MKINPALNKFFSRGFTLIELLIVIAVLGVLAAGVVVAINPIAKINSANLAKAETFAASIQNSLAMDLVGEWTFNDGTAKDTSGYGNNGAVVGATLTMDRKGQTNKAYSFDGNDYVSVPDSASLMPTQTMTIEAWSKKTGTGTGTIIAQYPAHNISIGADNVIRFTVNQNMEPNTSLEGGAIENNNWYHVVLVIDKPNTVAKAYLNGVLKNSITVSNTVELAYQYGLNIGAWKTATHSDYFNGTIDDIRIYSQALRLSQIQQLYAKGLPKHQLALKYNKNS